MRRIGASTLRDFAESVWLDHALDLAEGAGLLPEWISSALDEDRHGTLSALALIARIAHRRFQNGRYHPPTPGRLGYDLLLEYIGTGVKGGEFLLGELDRIAQERRRKGRRRAEAVS
jgi:hypothetical protein